MEAPAKALHKPYDTLGQRCTRNMIDTVTRDVVPVEASQPSPGNGLVALVRAVDLRASLPIYK